MKVHSEELKEGLKNLGRQQDVIITYTIEEEELVLTIENINSITPHYKASLLKSVMKQLDIDSNIDIPKGTEINFRWGLLVNGIYEYLDYGKYIVYSSEKQEDTNSYQLVCYDKMLYSMKDYESLDLEYPTTLATYLSALCQKLGFTLGTFEFANMNKQLPGDVFEKIGFTYRDVLDDIAEATGSTIYINYDNELVLGQITDTEDTIDEEYLKDVNVNFGEKYGPINSVVLSRAESDNVYIKDNESIEENGLCELKIKDNQIMNANNRSEYLQEIFEKVRGIEFYLNDFSSTGIMYYELLDRYNVQIGENTYHCVMFNDEQDITQGIEEQIYTEKPEVSETDYTKADKTDQRINQTTLMVDKQNQQIQALVSSNTELVQKTTQLTIDVNGIKGEIGEIADVTVTADGYGVLNVENINESEPILVKIYPTTEDITPLYPRNDLYPSNTLYPHNREIYFKKINESENEEQYQLEYNIPRNLYRLGNVYDEFVLDYENQECYIQHRIGKNSSNEKYVLDIEEKEIFDYPILHLIDGNYKIILPAFADAYIYVRLMTKNIYTSQFATKIELNSSIEQTANSISLNVNQKLSNYSTTQEMNSAIQLKADSITSTVNQKFTSYSTTSQMNSAITQKANEITSTVSSTYETKSNASTTKTNLQSQITQNATNITTKVSKNGVISSINQSSESVTINANKISLAGKTINLTSDNTIIKSNNFNVDKYGNLTCSNATITGGKINIKDATGEGNEFRIYTTASEALNLGSTLFNMQDAGNSYATIFMTVSEVNSNALISLTTSSKSTHIRADGIETSGTINSVGTYNNTVSNATNMYVTSAGNFRRTTSTSSKRYKKDIQEIRNDDTLYMNLLNLPVRQFKYKKEYQPSEEDVRYNKILPGFIAEELAELYPIAVDYEIDEDGNKIIETWNDRYIIPAMLKLIQELNEKIESRGV